MNGGDIKVGFKEGVGDKHLKATNGTAPRIVRLQALHRPAEPVFVLDQERFEPFAIGDPDEPLKSHLKHVQIVPVELVLKDVSLKLLLFTAFHSPVRNPVRRSVS